MTKRMKPIIKYIIVIGLLLPIPVWTLCCEKESPLDISHFDDFIRVPKITEEREPVRIEYESTWSYKNYDYDYKEKAGEHDCCYMLNDPGVSDVSLLVLVVIAGSFFTVSGVITYKIKHGNPLTDLE